MPKRSAILWLLGSLTPSLLLFGCSKNETKPLEAHGKPVASWIDQLKTAKAVKDRQHAARILGNVGAVDPSVVPALAEALKDKSADVRKEAITSLEKLGPAAQEALPALTEAQKDADPAVRAKAAEAVQHVKGGS